jgi:hypothetical protein
MGDPFMTLLRATDLTIMGNPVSVDRHSRNAIGEPPRTNILLKKRKHTPAGPIPDGGISFDQSLDSRYHLV